MNYAEAVKQKHTVPVRMRKSMPTIYNKKIGSRNNLNGTLDDILFSGFFFHVPIPSPETRPKGAILLPCERQSLALIIGADDLKKFEEWANDDEGWKILCEDASENQLLHFLLAIVAEADADKRPGLFLSGYSEILCLTTGC